MPMTHEPLRKSMDELRLMERRRVAAVLFSRLPEMPSLASTLASLQDKKPTPVDECYKLFRAKHIAAIVAARTLLSKMPPSELKGDVSNFATAVDRLITTASYLHRQQGNKFSDYVLVAKFSCTPCNCRIKKKKAVKNEEDKGKLGGAQSTAAPEMAKGELGGEHGSEMEIEVKKAEDKGYKEHKEEVEERGAVKKEQEEQEEKDRGEAENDGEEGPAKKKAKTEMKTEEEEGMMDDQADKAPEGQADMEVEEDKKKEKNDAGEVQEGQQDELNQKELEMKAEQNGEAEESGQQQDEVKRMGEKMYEGGREDESKKSMMGHISLRTLAAGEECWIKVCVMESLLLDVEPDDKMSKELCEEVLAKILTTPLIDFITDTLWPLVEGKGIEKACCSPNNGV